MGIGLLIPWNAFITAADFFAAKYPGRHADRLMTVAYLPVQLVVLAVMIRYDVHLPTRPRIIAGFGVFAAIMLVVPLVRTLSALLTSRQVCNLSAPPPCIYSVHALAWQPCEQGAHCSWRQCRLGPCD